MKNEGLRIEALAGTDDIDDALSVRHEVFVEGQGIDADTEIDGLDPECDHYVGYLDGDPVAVTRVRYLSPTEAKLERVATVEIHRGKGVATDLTVRIIGDMALKRIDRVSLNAQTAVQPFYERLGFTPKGDAFIEEGTDIPHIEMTATISRNF